MALWSEAFGFCDFLFWNLFRFSVFGLRISDFGFPSFRSPLRRRLCYAVLMLMELALTAKVFEAVMLICFGVSWPVSIAKTLRVRRVEGKSPLFLTLIFIGYVAGVIYKVLDARVDGEAISQVTWLYVLNGAMVFIDLMLYRKFRVVRNRAPS